MSGNFWKKLKKPIFVIAPMANVTDYAFRTMFTKYGKPDVMWTEFVSADGLCSEGKDKLLNDLKFSPKERPIVAQLFTGHPDKMLGAAKIVAKLGFDGLDINMGCPDRSVEKQGGGSAMIKSPKVALEVLEAARNGFDGPVSVKTRIGYNSVDWKWLRLLLEQNLPVLTVHLRTRKEMSDIGAHWELMPEIVKLRDEVQVQAGVPLEEKTLIIGNGDVESMADAQEKVEKYGCDGVMIGRGIFGKPWFFKEVTRINKSTRIPQIDEKIPEERLKIMLEHAKLFNKLYCKKGNSKSAKKSHKNFAVMKKHFKAYVSGFDGAKELRVKLMEAETCMDVEKIVKRYLIKK